VAEVDCWSTDAQLIQRICGDCKYLCNKYVAIVPEVSGIAGIIPVILKP